MSDLNLEEWTEIIPKRHAGPGRPSLRVPIATLTENGALIFNRAASPLTRDVTRFKVWIKKDEILLQDSVEEGFSLSGSGHPATRIYLKALTTLRPDMIGSYYITPISIEEEEYLLLRRH